MKEKFNQLVKLFLGTRLYLLIAPYLVFYAGVAANQAVLVANGGKFPVMVNERSAKTFGFESDGFSDDIHFRMSGETKLNWLADWINLHTSILSPGDVLIMLGDLLKGSSLAIWGALALGDLSKFTTTFKLS